jgi:hypothetical protein
MENPSPLSPHSTGSGGEEVSTCSWCGQELQVGDWPWCPHGRSKGDEHKSSYVPDEIPGGLTLENVGPEPVTVYSRTEMNQLFESRGLQRKERFCPTPGTDKDPAGIPNPRGYMDPQTLANGAELILRAARAKAESEKQAREDAAFAERAYRPAEPKVLTEAEAIEAHRAIQQREEEARARRR